MDVLYLLIPLSVVLVFFVLGALGWAIWRGQFGVVSRLKTAKFSRYQIQYSRVHTQTENILKIIVKMFGYIKF